MKYRFSVDATIQAGSGAAAWKMISDHFAWVAGRGGRPCDFGPGAEVLLRDTDDRDVLETLSPPDLAMIAVERAMIDSSLMTEIKLDLVKWLRAASARSPER